MCVFLPDPAQSLAAAPQGALSEERRRHEASSRLGVGLGCVSHVLPGAQMLSVSLSVFSLSLSIFSHQYLTFFLSLSLTHTLTHNWQQQRPDKRHPEQEKTLAAS